MLSKSRILNGLQCPKRLYLQVHRPDLGEIDAGTEHRFQVGHEVGEVARSLQPGGKLVADEDLDAALAATGHELSGAGDKVLFEPAFAHSGVLIRADILSRRGNDIELREVKSSTSVKDYHQQDVAVQVWTLRGAGAGPSRVYVTHIDNTFVYQGDGRYAGLLRDTDVTAAVAPTVDKVAGWVNDFSQVLDGAMPAVEMGPHCSDPFECPFQRHCSAGGPAFPVEILPRGGKTLVAIREAGLRDLRDVPEDMLKSANHLRVWRATRSGRVEIVKGAGAELVALPYPRYYVDFETTQMAVPAWAGTRPYEQLPFQWSCHVEKADGSLEERGFLDVSGRPPMRAFAESLSEVLGTTGPVFTYTAFERTVLTLCAEHFPDLAEKLGRIVDRIVDLRPLTERSYYHPKMMGSWSIKAVVPTIAPELDYAGLGEVQDGTQAQVAYLEAIHPQTAPERRLAIERGLLTYCKHDTLVMVRLVHFLIENC
jgi:uncharacterized protein DUF2779